MLVFPTMNRGVIAIRPCSVPRTISYENGLNGALTETMGKAKQALPQVREPHMSWLSYE